MKGGIYHKYITPRYNHTRSKYTRRWAIDHCNSLHLSADIKGLKPFVNTWHNSEKNDGYAIRKIGWLKVNEIHLKSVIGLKLLEVVATY